MIILARAVLWFFVFLSGCPDGWAQSSEGVVAIPGWALNAKIINLDHPRGPSPLPRLHRYCLRDLVRSSKSIKIIKSKDCRTLSVAIELPGQRYSNLAINLVKQKVFLLYTLVIKEDALRSDLSNPSAIDHYLYIPLNGEKIAQIGVFDITSYPVLDLNRADEHREDSPWAAAYEAESSLKKHGYSYSVFEGTPPMGVKDETWALIIMKKKVLKPVKGGLWEFMDPKKLDDCMRRMKMKKVILPNTGGGKCPSDKRTQGISANLVDR